MADILKSPPSCILHILKFWLEKKNTQKFTSDKLFTSYTVLGMFGMTWLKQSSLCIYSSNSRETDI